SNQVRNSLESISSTSQSMRAGHQCGAERHQVGGASTLATQVALDWVMYCSIPKNANGMVSRPSTVPAIQPEVFSRSCCSIVGTSCSWRSRPVYPQWTTCKTKGPHRCGPLGWN